MFRRILLAAERTRPSFGAADAAPGRHIEVLSGAHLRFAHQLPLAAGLPMTIPAGIACECRTLP